MCDRFSRRWRNLSALIFSTLATVSVAALPALAQTNWTDPIGGDFNDPNNWSAGVPDPNTDAVFDPNNTYTVTLTQNETVTQSWSTAAATSHLPETSTTTSPVLLVQTSLETARSGWTMSI